MAFVNATFGEGTGRIHLHHFHCTGTESALLNCSIYRKISHACFQHKQDAGVRIWNYALLNYELWIDESFTLGKISVRI